jgi:hypothetical protein
MAGWFGSLCIKRSSFNTASSSAFDMSSFVLMTIFYFFLLFVITPRRQLMSNFSTSALVENMARQALNKTRPLSAMEKAADSADTHTILLQALNTKLASAEKSAVDSSRLAKIAIWISIVTGVITSTLAIVSIIFSISGVSPN